MFAKELTKEEWDTLVKHLHLDGKTERDQFDVILTYGEKCLDRAYEYLLRHCPAQHLDEFQKRAALPPEKSGFKEFIGLAIPKKIDPIEVWAYASSYD